MPSSSHPRRLLAVLAVAFTLQACGGTDTPGQPTPNPTSEPLSAQLTAESLGTPQFTPAELEALALINQARAQGVSCNDGSTFMPPVEPFKMEGHLHLAARRHSADMLNRAYFAHRAPDPAPHGTTPRQRIENAGLSGAVAFGENLAAGVASPAEAVKLWLASKAGHCQALMSAEYQYAGIGLVQGTATIDDNGVPTLTTDFWTNTFAGTP